ncbi:MAG: hypothetical protein AAF959_23630 [Cyanobacteria bacterium P01_D01_bin.56]
MRTFVCSTDAWLRFLGSTAKGLFVATFVSAVMIVLVAAFGSEAVAVMTFWAAWAIFWRAWLTLMALIAVTTLLGIWSPKQGGFSPSMLQQIYPSKGNNVINFRKPHFHSSKVSHKPYR